MGEEYRVQFVDGIGEQYDFIVGSDMTFYNFKLYIVGYIMDRYAFRFDIGIGDINFVYAVCNLKFKLTDFLLSATLSELKEIGLFRSDYDGIYRLGLELAPSLTKHILSLRAQQKRIEDERLAVLRDRSEVNRSGVNRSEVNNSEPFILMIKPVAGTPTEMVVTYDTSIDDILERLQDEWDENRQNVKLVSTISRDIAIDDVSLTIGQLIRSGLINRENPTLFLSYRATGFGYPPKLGG